ncbi:MAG: hypothetical protein ALECFALPRED_001918 [Alectoria fallacina]|uniref:Uncharacterized protein n=1 Tax=Alectoria fallacina TaxID=1903189 RepID=A0A8H3I3J9_9LECA|nr:MAG: hypothetical protein ALECFALPRED_001918 [Alectoria fallacina]
MQQSHQTFPVLASNADLAEMPPKIFGQMPDPSHSSKELESLARIFDEDCKASVSDTGSDTAGADRPFEQQYDEIDRLLESNFMSLAGQELHSPSSASRRKIESVAATATQDVRKCDEATMDDVRAEINGFGEDVGRLYNDGVMGELRAEIRAFGEDVERLHTRVHEMKSELEKDIEKLRQKNLEMDLWYEAKTAPRDMEDDRLHLGIDGTGEEMEAENEVAPAYSHERGSGDSTQ